MSIVKFSEFRTRRKIGFLSAVPTGADDIFRDRGYECVLLDKVQSPGGNALWELDCLILLQNPDDPKLISEELKTYAPLLLPRDGRIYILPASQESLIGLQFRRQIIAAIGEHRVPNSGLSSLDRKRFAEWDDEPNYDSFGPFAHVFNVIAPFDWNHIANIILSNSASAAPPRPAPNICARKSDGEDISLCDEAT